MSKNTSNINHLEAKARILAAIRGSGYDPTPIAEANGDDEDSSLADDDRSAVETPGDGQAIAGEPLADALARYAGDAPGTPLPPDPRDVLTPVTRDDNPGAYTLQSYLGSRVAPKTRRTMFQGGMRIARLLGVELETIQWHELRFEHTDVIRAKLLTGGYSRSTIEVTLAALKGFLHQAARLRLMTQEDFHNAVDWDRLGLETLPVGRELTQREIDRIQAHIASFEGSPYGCFLEALFALLLGLGLRRFEPCGVALTAFNAQAATLKVERKGGKQQELPLGQPEVAAIQTWLEARRFFERRCKTGALLMRVHPNDWVRPATPDCSEQHIAHVCTRVGREAGVEAFTPHDLRRTFCTRAIRESGGDFGAVQELMGHSKIETTRRYDKRTLEEHAAKRKRWNIWRPAPKLMSEELPVVDPSRAGPAND